MRSDIGKGGNRKRFVRAGGRDEMLAQAPVAICLLDGSDFRYSFTNALYDKLIGRKGVLGLPIGEAHPELEGREFYELPERAFRSGERQVGRECQIRRAAADGAVRTGYFHVSCQPLRNPAGIVESVLVTVADVTEQVLLRKSAEETARSRDEFLSIACHELKTPITGLKLQLQLAKHKLRADVNCERYVSMLEVCHRQVDRLTNMIDTLFDVTRIQAGRMEFRFEEFKLGGLVEEVLEKFAGQLDAAGTRVATDVRGDLSVCWDRFRMDQVLCNLVSNAIKYAPGKPLSIKAGKFRSTIVFTVRDRGPGIPKSQQERIFRRFERANNSSCVGGLGLGLYIAGEIIRGHSGEIWVESEAGLGAAFVARIPVRPQAPAGDPLPHSESFVRDRLG